MSKFIVAIIAVILLSVPVAADGITGNEVMFDHAATEYDLDAGTLAAIAILESGWGRSELAKNKYNLYGWTTDDGGWMSFEGWEKCVFHVAEAIQNRPHDTIMDIANWYHPHDPEIWADAVEEIRGML